MPRAAAAVTCRSRLASHAAGQNLQEASLLANDAVSRPRSPNFHQLVSVAMLPAALRAISPKAVTICCMFSGA